MLGCSHVSCGDKKAIFWARTTKCAVKFNRLSLSFTNPPPELLPYSFPKGDIHKWCLLRIGGRSEIPQFCKQMHWLLNDLRFVDILDVIHGCPLTTVKTCGKRRHVIQTDSTVSGGAAATNREIVSANRVCIGHFTVALSSLTFVACKLRNFDSVTSSRYLCGQFSRIGRAI